MYNTKKEFDRDQEQNKRYSRIRDVASLEKYKDYFKNKLILVTGGTGSFGHQMVSTLLGCETRKIIVFSRDEKKQVDMQRDYDSSSQLEFIVGDVRDYHSVLEAMEGVDIVYHAAALKQVPNCEKNPFEAVKTNIVGAENVRRAALARNVGAVIAISTDKAAKPVNVMGMTKALQERIFVNYHRNERGTRFICVRYGNVVGSRGSVIPFFRERIKAGKPLPVTHSDMTRFLLTLEDAVGLVWEATVHGQGSDLFVKKMPACYTLDLAKVMSRELTGKEDYPIEIVGIRSGEKIHEVLVSEEEMLRAVETESHYIVYSYGKIEKPSLLRDIREYTSANTEIFDHDQIRELLLKEGWI